MNDKLILTFGRNLKTYRLKSGLSQEKLADMCGLHRTYISAVERGARNISITNIERIAKILKVSAYKLLVEKN